VTDPLTIQRQFLHAVPGDTTIVFSRRKFCHADLMAKPLGTLMRRLAVGLQ
jgi:hypothetical protein